MKERDLAYWMKFSHEWSLYVLAGFAALIALTVLANLYAKRRRSISPGSWVPKWIAGVVNLSMAVGTFFFLYTQSHYVCSIIVSAKTKCLSNAKALVGAELLYVSDNDGKFSAVANWPREIRLDDGRHGDVLACPTAGGSFGYSLNKGLVSKNLFAMDDSDVVLVFDSKGAPVCGQEGLDSSRHLGHPMIAFVDGRAVSSYPSLIPVKW